MSQISEPVAFREQHLPLGPHRLHVRMGGRESALPTVVLEAGGGSTLSVWREIEAGLAAHTRVLSYERASIGGSSGPVGSVQADAVAERLAALLQAAGVTGPVILAGHSLGGLYSRYFAATRPATVAGLVLLDPTPEDLHAPPVRWVPALLWLLHGIARLPPTQWLLPLLKRTPAERDTRRAEIRTLARPGHIRSLLAESHARSDIQAEVARVTGAADAPRLPTLVITAGDRPPAMPPDMSRDILRNHERVAAAGLPPHSRHLSIADANHMSLLKDPRHGAAVAAQILDFARQITGASAA